MEASDTFGAGVDAPTDDPFAGSEAEFEQQDPLGPEGEPPVVNREGERVDGGTGLPSSEDQAMLDEADRLREDQAAAEAEDAADEQTQQDLLAQEAQEPAPETRPTEPATAGGPSAAATAGEPGGTEPDPTKAASEVASPASGTTPNSDQATPSSPAAADANAPATPPGDGGPTSAPATPPSGDAAEAEPPEEKKDKKGAVTHRRYMIFQPEGEGKWSEVHWYEKDDNIVKAGTTGAKKQKVCLARGQEEALAIGFAAIGSPPDGAPLVAVAVTYWQLRHVAPDPMPITRQRLKIR